LEYEQLATGTILVIIRDNNELQKGKVTIYCRVSSSQNKSNLESQKQRLLDYCSDRFARFGTNYIELLLKKQGGSLEIINKTGGDKEGLM